MSFVHLLLLGFLTVTCIEKDSFQDHSYTYDYQSEEEQEEEENEELAA